MNYRKMEKTGDSLSLLGYGCMRFPRRGGAIDEKRAKEQILMAAAQGVNYFDTAYMYPGSEKVLGKIIAENNLREKIKVATKLPHMMIKKRQDMDKIFQKQLNALQTDYIDYYLMHNISAFEDWQRLKELGIESFIQEEQKKGRIRHIGFSSHGNARTYKKLIDDYPWDFCQMQLNYLDESFQSGIESYHYATEKELGIVIMEPLRGGLLGARAPEAVKKVLSRQNSDWSPAEWAFRWIYSLPGVHVVLSGMNEEEHIEENIRIASDPNGYILSETEQTCIYQAKEIIQEKMQVPCTGCAYCMPCPHGVDIPTCFAWYNQWAMHGGIAPVYHYVQTTEGAVNGKPSKASLCKSCGVCKTHCPQQIDIPEELKKTAKKMEKPIIRVPVGIALKFMSH